VNLKPYIYYRQQYPGLSKSNDDSINLTVKDCKEVTDETNSGCQTLDSATGIEKQSGKANFETGKEDTLEQIKTLEHSRFQEVAPGVFQFKHTRPNMVQHPPAPMVNHYVPEYLGGTCQPDNKPEVDEFVRVGFFPGASDYGLPVYQFT